MNKYFQPLLDWYNDTWVVRNSILIWRIVAIIMMVGGLVSAGFYLYDLHNEYAVFTDGEIDVAKTGAVGDFIAGTIGTVFSLAGFIIVYLTYKDQVRSNEKDKIEQRFFTLLQIHVDNSNNISYQNPYNGNNSN